MNIEYMKPFADWISISFPTSRSPHMDVISLLNQHTTYHYVELGGGKELYKTGNSGTILVTSKEDYVNLSISGSQLRLAREVGVMSELEQLLASSPYNITRLDIAYDVPIAGPIVLDNIKQTFPSGYAKLAGRDRQLQFTLNQIDSKTQTGTCYFQTKKYNGTVRLTVYDKAWEQLNEQSVVIKPTTRYEFRISRGASLRDFRDPTSMFWHFMPSDVLSKPKNVITYDWVASERISYDEFLDSKITDYQRLKFLIENSPALLQLVRQANTTTGGRQLLEREISYMFQNAVGMQRSGDSEDADSSTGLTTS